MQLLQLKKVAKAIKKKKNAFGKLISGKLHLWLGLCSGLVVVIVSLTGCLFVFEEEIRNLTQKEIRFIKPIPGKEFISINTLHACIQKELPNETIKQIRIFSAPDKAWQVHLTEEKAAAINPYTGALIKIYSRKDWLSIVEKIHTSLLLGNTGKWIIKINVALFLVLLITGIILWWPSNKARRKQSFKVKWNASGKRINYDFHNVFGFYSSLLLLLIVLTGLYMSFDWMKRLAYFATGSNYLKITPSKINTPAGAEIMLTSAAVYNTATQQYPGAAETHINMPQKNGEAFKIKMHYPSPTYKKVNELLFNPYSGEIITAALYKNYNAGDIIKHSNRDLHTGAFWGLFGKILAFLASLIAASMPITGFAIWWVRTKKKKPVKTKIAAVTTTKTTVRQPA